MYKILKKTKKRENILEKMKELSLDSKLRSKHCACLVKGNKIISFAINNYIINTKFKSIHAEIALDKNLNKSKIKNIKKTTYNLWVIRYSENNGLLESKPCYHCICYIKKHMTYINNIIYSTTPNEIIKIKKKYIENNHKSIFYKHNS